MKALSVACYFVQQAEEFGRELTNLDLQKLVYFAHGWHLAIVDQPLIEEDIQAWKYGPVIPELYHQLKVFGSDPVPLSKIKKKCENFEEISSEQTVFLESVWQVYKGYDTMRLVRTTHAGDTPWDKIIREHGGVPSNVVIPNLNIKNFFKSKLSNG